MHFWKTTRLITKFHINRRSIFMSKSIFKRILPVIMGACAFMLLLGNLAVVKSVMPESYFTPALTHVVCAVILAAGCSFCKRDQILKAAPYLTGALFILLLALPFIGYKVNGALRWIRIGGVYFSPAVFAMPILCLFWGWLLQQKGKTLSLKHKSILFGIFAFAAILIFCQPFVGISFIILILAAVLHCLSGGSTIKTLLAGSIVFIAGIVLPLVATGRIHRIYTFPGPWQHLPGVSFFQTKQLVAILKHSVFLGPHQAPDHLIGQIITTPESALVLGCGKFGFAFLIAAILLMLVIITGGFIICRLEKDPVERLLSGSMTTVLLLPFVVNLLAMSGFLPPGSIGFPFLSYGGNAMLAYAFALSFFFNRKI